MTLLAERPSRFKRFARSALPRPARNWLRRPVESVHYMDDEGSVLAGARQTLTAGGRRPTVFLELHNDIIRARGEAPACVLEMLGTWGYRLEAPGGARLTADAAVRPAVTRLVALPCA